MRLALTAALAALAIGWACPAWAADWTDSVFPDRAHDFGTVARRSKVRHAFKVVNTTNQEIHIDSWKAKCGCTEVKVGARDIPPGTQTVIEAVIDTTNFSGLKASGFVLMIDRPSPISVDFSTTCFIRDDLSLTPGQVDFGVVNRSKEPKVELALAYAGNKPDWEVTGMGTISDHIIAELVEVGRSPGGLVSYRLTATLRPSAPIGIFKDEITLKTNDPTAPRVPVSVSAVVQSNVTVSPTVINLGRVKPGESIGKTLIVRSSQPFKITGMSPSKPDFALPAVSEVSKALHSVVFTFKAPAQPGPYNATIEVATDIKDEPPARLTAFATIVP